MPAEVIDKDAEKIVGLREECSRRLCVKNEGNLKIRLSPSEFWANRQKDEMAQAIVDFLAAGLADYVDATQPR